MAELLRPTIVEASSFATERGYPLESADVLNVFPTFFPERRVLQVKSAGREQSRVLKFRPHDEGAEREVKKLEKLLSSYRFSGVAFDYLKVHRLPERQYLVMDMPYLGVTLHELAMQMDMLDLGYLEPEEAWFKGFTDRQADDLVEQLIKSHLAFARKYCHLHGDVFQRTAPNNIVYHPDLQRLFLVDAEALAPVQCELCDDKRATFIGQMEAVDAWIAENLVA